MKADFFLTLVLLAVCHHSIAVAQSPGTFTATGSMTTPRELHAATLLLDGKVLITGGYSASDEDYVLLPAANAELYDPSTGVFTITSDMMSGVFAPYRVTQPYPGVPGAKGTLLPDGRVFVGGTVLRDGRVFIAGYPTAEVCDPVTNICAATVPYAAPKPAILGSSTLLADGRVLLTGAVNICFQPLCSDPGTSWTELFDPTAGTFSLTGSMKGYNNTYTATLLTDGRVLFVGNDYYNGETPFAEVFDPSNETFKVIEPPSAIHEYPRYTILLMDGKVLFVGNDTHNGVPSFAEVFDPSNETFKVIEPPSASHQYGAAKLLPDGTVLFTGGLTPDDKEQVAAELYIPASRTFSAAVNMIKGHSYHTSTLLSDGTVLIAGSTVGAPIISSAELYHPAVLIPAPLLFSLSGDGRGQGAIWHAATGQLVSQGAPATAGEILSMYTTGLGQGNVIPPQVAIGSRFAEVLFFGNAPGYPGFNQVNVRMPGGVAPSPAIPVRLIYLGRPSNAVTIGVQ